MSTKKSYERKRSTLKSLRYPDALISEINKVKGDETFSGWVMRVLNEQIDKQRPLVSSRQQKSPQQVNVAGLGCSTHDEG
jgi:hypothetical protein